MVSLVASAVGFVVAVAFGRYAATRQLVWFAAASIVFALVNVAVLTASAARLL